MKLPFSLPLKKKIKNQYFLALLLRDEKATAVIFEEIEGKVRIVGEHEERFVTSLEDASIDELLEVLDKAISNAESSLDESVQTQQTVFGVKDSWVADEKIKKEFLLKLKKVSESLTLSPIGFLVISEAIAHLLSKEEGVPVSTILVELEEKAVTVSIIRAGRVIETKTKPLGESTVKTTDLLLHSFTKAEIFPARVIILNSGYKEQLIQEFTTHNWSKQLPFLHVPQISVLSKSFDARAVLFGAAAQMGFEVLKEDLDDATIITKPKQEAPFEDALQVSNEESTLSAFGFVKEQDVLQMEEDEPEEEITAHAPIADDSSSRLTMDEEVEKHEQVPKENAAYQEEKTGGSLFWMFVIGIGKISHMFTAMTRKIIALGGGSKFIFIPPAIIALVIGFLLLYIFFVKATVSLSLKAKNVEQKQDITFAVDGSSDYSKNIIAAESFSVDEEGAVSTDATGKKEIGEKAKGSVTISSVVTQEKTLTQGATVTYLNSLPFVLDSDVKLASSSGLSDIKTAKVSVTAKNIGKEYNLPSGTKFSIAGFAVSEMEGKNESAFAGGSKKDITVVSKEDIAKLQEELPKDLEEKAKKDMQKKIPDDRELLPVSVSQEITKSEYSKKVGDEATSIALKGTVTFNSLTYKKSDFESFGKELLKNSIGDMEVTKDGIQFDVQDIKEGKDKTVKSSVSLRANLLPTVDTPKLSQEIAGKSFDEAKTILGRLSQVESVEIVLHPNIPFLPKVLPRMSKNITVVRVNNE